MEKKKLKINMSKLSIGGMEKALVDLLNNSDIVEKYDVTLMLVYNVPKNYLDLVPKDVKIDLVYKGKWNIFGKLITGLRLIKRLIFAKKYYCSICYSHQHGILAKITRKESLNSIAFIHTELKKSRTQKELTRLMKNMKFEKFPKIVCVSNCTKKSFLELIPNYTGHVVVANNYIDYDNILKKCKPNCKFHQFLNDNLSAFIMQKVISLNSRVELLTKRSIRDKLLGYFTILSTRTLCKSFSLPFSLTDLADYLSVDRSAMMRELKSLKDDGFIEKNGNTITLLYK